MSDTERYNAIYKTFNLDERQIKLAKNILRVDPYKDVGALAILTYAFLIDSYGFPELTAATVVNRSMPAIESIFSAPSEAHICIVIVDKAFVIAPDPDPEQSIIINLADMSELTVEEFASAMKRPITNDAIDLNAVAKRLILPSPESSAPAPEAAQ